MQHYALTSALGFIPPQHRVMVRVAHRFQEDVSNWTVQELTAKKLLPEDQVSQASQEDERGGIPLASKDVKQTVDRLLICETRVHNREYIHTMFRFRNK